jgi:hypothetical protein
MTRPPNPLEDPLWCTIYAEGTLDPRLSEQLGSLHIRAAAAGGRPVTQLSGPLLDQIALVHVLAALRDLGLSLLSVTWQTEPPPLDERRRPERVGDG